MEELAVDTRQRILVEGTKLLGVETERLDLSNSHVHERYREHCVTN
jgi:hypothetical protein